MDILEEINLVITSLEKTDQILKDRGIQFRPTNEIEKLKGVSEYVESETMKYIKVLRKTKDLET